MVTIDPNTTILNVPDHKAAATGCDEQKGGFDSIFKNAVDARTTEAAKMESTHLVPDLRPPQFVTESMPSTNRVVDQVQRLIDTMEAYQQKLIENGATLKEIQSVVQEMASRSESLSAVSNAVEEQKNLKTIVEQSLMLASMEIAKFNSGCYNDT